jgi:very-short-patch-repair endonuclease
LARVFTKENFGAIPLLLKEGSGVVKCVRILKMKKFIANENDTVLEKINNRTELKIKRKDLRNRQTPAELKLWFYLKDSKLENRKFRRQHSVGNFILDFYCPKERLAIELDGDSHFTKTGKEYDNHRTRLLKDFRIKIVRFTNNLIFENIEQVLNLIKNNFSV